MKTKIFSILILPALLAVSPAVAKNDYIQPGSQNSKYAIFSKDVIVNKAESIIVSRMKPRIPRNKQPNHLPQKRYQYEYKQADGDSASEGIEKKARKLQERFEQYKDFRERLNKDNCEDEERAEEHCETERKSRRLPPEILHRIPYKDLRAIDSRNLRP